MPEHFKLWQRRAREDYTSELREIDGIDRLDSLSGTLICVPGYSTTHENPKEINGYMGVAQEILGGKEAKVNLVSISYPSTKGEAPHISRFNDDPLRYVSPGAQEFAHTVLLPLLQAGVDINILAKSYGPIFYNMAMNELRRFGKTGAPSCVRMLATANIARLSYERPCDATEIYVEGIGDLTARELNDYIEPPLKPLGNLNLKPLSATALLAQVAVPEGVLFWSMSPEGAELRKTTDTKKHTTRLFTNTPDYVQMEFLRRILRNMFALPGSEFTIDRALEPSPSLVPQRHEIGRGEEVFDMRISSQLKRDLLQGWQSRKVKAVMFDWDLTLADAEDVNLACLNATFHAMEAKGQASPKALRRKEMRQVFIGTAPSFFEGIYGEQGDIVVAEAIAAFRKFREEKRSETKLLPGAKELLRMLKENGVKIAIVSNKDMEELQSLKEALLPESEFSDIVIIGYEPGRNAKPSAEPIYAALKALRMPRSMAASVLFVGDQVRTDIAAAIEAGCKPCLIGKSDKQQLFSSRRHTLHQGDKGRHAILQGESGHRILYVQNLHSLTEFLAKNMQQASNGLSL